MQGIDEEKAVAARKAREDRNESLRKMMEDDDGKLCSSMSGSHILLTLFR
jgi:hypothetical protein